MDKDEESAVEAATACKRQKRNSSHEDGRLAATDAATAETDDTSTDAEAETLGATAAAATPTAEEQHVSMADSPQNGENGSNANNNNNSSGSNAIEEQNEEETQEMAISISDNNASGTAQLDEPAEGAEMLPEAVTASSAAATVAVAAAATDGDGEDGDNIDVDDIQMLVNITTALLNHGSRNRSRVYRTQMADATDSSRESPSSSSSSSSAHDEQNDEYDSGSDVLVREMFGSDHDPHEFENDSNGQDDEDPPGTPSDNSFDAGDLFDSDSSPEPDPESEGDQFYDGVTSSADKAQIQLAVKKVTGKEKPPYSWNCMQALMQREQQLFNRIDWRGGQTSNHSFNQGFYGSRQAVERLQLLQTMKRHRGCVNCLNFNRSGDLLCSGSDDLDIVVWDWPLNRPFYRFRSGHSLNIFQTKFIDSDGCLDIVSTSRDGQVRRAVIPPSGGCTVHPMRLYSHSEPVHKLIVVPHSKHEVMSAGEDSAVKHFDLRSNKVSTLVGGLVGKQKVRLYSISHHPFAPEFCISGSDSKLRVYDKRKLKKPVHVMVPKDLMNLNTHISCAVYNHSGSEILASYSESGIYLFDSRKYQDGEYLHCYEGHINSRTIKGVNFFGPQSEYIVSGSDCGHIFFWDKNTESVINFMKGDFAGVVNCLEPHPTMPVLATSGLEHHVKLWSPGGADAEKEESRASALESILQRNFRRNILDMGDFNMSQVHYFIRQLVGMGSARHGRNDSRNINNVNTTREQGDVAVSISSSSDDDSDAAAPSGCSNQ